MFINKKNNINKEYLQKLTQQNYKSLAKVQEETKNQQLLKLKVKNFIEEKLFPKLEETAKEGKSSYIFKVSIFKEEEIEEKIYFHSELVSQLTSKGFKVYRGRTDMIYITWD